MPHMGPELPVLYPLISHCMQATPGRVWLWVKGVQRGWGRGSPEEAARQGHTLWLSQCPVAPQCQESRFSDSYLGDVSSLTSCNCTVGPAQSLPLCFLGLVLGGSVELCGLFVRVIFLKDLRWPRFSRVSSRTGRGKAFLEWIHC